MQCLKLASILVGEINVPMYMYHGLIVWLSRVETCAGVRATRRRAGVAAGVRGTRGRAGVAAGVRGTRGRAGVAAGVRGTRRRAGVAAGTGTSPGVVGPVNAFLVCCVQDLQLPCRRSFVFLFYARRW